MRFLTTRAQLFSVIVLPVGVALALQGHTESLETGPTARVAQDVTYATDVAPILEARCVMCHGGIDPQTGEPRVEVEFNMTTYEGLMAGSEYGTVIEPGDPDGSLLLDMVESGDMPNIGDPLQPVQIEILRSWIASGAADN